MVIDFIFISCFANNAMNYEYMEMVMKFKNLLHHVLALKNSSEVAMGTWEGGR